MKYCFAVEGFDSSPDIPLFTSCVTTYQKAEFVKHRMIFQGLNVVIRPIEEMKGLNPCYET